MARLSTSKISKSDKIRNSIHDIVESTYTTFEKDGETFIQIDTYGKSDRKIKDKISQSMQLDRNSAKFIVELLKKEYDF